MSDKCVFCRKALQNNEAFTVCKDDGVAGVLDIFPRTKGHMLIAPIEHYATLFDMPKDLTEAVFRTVVKSCKILREFGAKGVNLGSNIGEIAGQQMPHFHVHVIPRYEKDDAVEIEPAFVNTPWRQKCVRLSADEMKQIAYELRRLYTGCSS